MMGIGGGKNGEFLINGYNVQYSKIKKFQRSAVSHSLQLITYRTLKNLLRGQGFTTAKQKLKKNIKKESYVLLEHFLHNLAQEGSREMSLRTTNRRTDVETLRQVGGDKWFDSRRPSTMRLTVLSDYHERRRRALPKEPNIRTK